MAAGARVRRIADGTAWREFCRELERAGEALLRESTPDDPLQQAEGLRYPTRTRLVKLAELDSLR
jgi:hypothetical protein